MAGSSDEFPLLEALGLVAVDIRGDGNCLFNALSDQIYGHQNEHQKIRARVIEYMREHASYYKQFIDVQPGGGHRRNPKRKNAGIYSTINTFTPPSQEEIDRVFESHLSSMAQGGTYGDNMEISAFTSAYGVDVKIYQHDFAYMISDPDDGTPRPIAHIAYHTWEHYSSIRNIGGPHTGLPKVSPKVLSPEDDARNRAAAAKMSHVPPWMIKVVMSSLPYLADRETIKKTLEECKGNIDTAVSILLDAEERGSVSSQTRSSSNERDPDSDDDELNGPNKKQDRRMSRATKAAKEKAEKAALAEKAQLETPNPTVTITKPEPIQPKQVTSPTVKLPIRPQRRIVPNMVVLPKKVSDDDEWGTPSDEGDDDFHPEGEEGDEDANSEYSFTSKSQPREFEPILPPILPKPKLQSHLKISVPTHKTFQKPAGPQRKRITARERIELKKAAQKAARKESKRNTAQAARQLEVTSVNVSKSAPPLDLGMGIKTLYI